MTPDKPIGLFDPDNTNFLQKESKNENILFLSFTDLRDLRSDSKILEIKVRTKGAKMTNSELHELLKRELALPSEIQKKKHPTIKSSKAEFVDYAKDGKFTLAYPLRPDQRNGYHLLQGGYISVFFDDNFGLFAYVASEGHSFPTISFTVNLTQSGS